MALYIAAQSSIICCLPAATALWIQNLGGLTVNILLNVIGYSLVSSLSSHLSNFWSRDDFLQNFFLPRLQTLETAYKLWFSRTREHRRSRRMHLVLQTIPLVFCQYEIYQGQHLLRCADAKRLFMKSVWDGILLRFRSGYFKFAVHAWLVIIHQD